MVPLSSQSGTDYAEVPFNSRFGKPYIPFRGDHMRPTGRLQHQLVSKMLPEQLKMQLDPIQFRG